MFFKKAKFFLDLTGEDNGSNAQGADTAPVAAVIAPVAPVDPAAVAAVAVAPALVSALVTIGTKGSSGLGLDQGLQPLAHQFGDQLAGGAAAKQLRQFRGGRIRDGHGLVSGRW